MTNLKNNSKNNRKSQNNIPKNNQSPNQQTQPCYTAIPAVSHQNRQY